MVEGFAFVKEVEGSVHVRAGMGVEGEFAGVPAVLGLCLDDGAAVAIEAGGEGVGEVGDAHGR